MLRALGEALRRPAIEVKFFCWRQGDSAITFSNLVQMHLAERTLRYGRRRKIASSSSVVSRIFCKAMPLAVTPYQQEEVNS